MSPKSATIVASVMDRLLDVLSKLSCEATAYGRIGSLCNDGHVVMAIILVAVVVVGVIFLWPFLLWPRVTLYNLAIRVWSDFVRPGSRLVAGHRCESFSCRRRRRIVVVMEHGGYHRPLIDVLCWPAAAEAVVLATHPCTTVTSYLSTLTRQPCRLYTAVEHLTNLYTVSQKKTSHFNFRHNFAICWDIFTIFEAFCSGIIHAWQSVAHIRKGLFMW